MSSDDTKWVRLQNMAENMLDAAKESDWETLIYLNEQRQPVLENYFTNVAPSLDTELLRDRIHVLQAMEQQILQCSQTMRDGIAKELKDIHRGKRVGKTYSTYAAA